MPTQPKPKTIKRAGWMPKQLLKDIRHMLEAMNASPAHAVSWVRPQTEATTIMIKRIDRALARIDHDTKPPKDPASTLRRIRD